MSKETSAITSKGQVTIPKRMRERLRIGEGDTVAFELRDGELVLRKLKRRSILSMGGVARRSGAGG